MFEWKESMNHVSQAGLSLGSHNGFLILNVGLMLSLDASGIRASKSEHMVTQQA